MGCSQSARQRTLAPSSLVRIQPPQPNNEVKVIVKGLTGVLIMAAGKGTRMRTALPKVLQPLLDRPMLDYLLRSVLSSDAQVHVPQNGVKSVAVLVGSGGEQVEEHLAKDFQGSLKILWQKEQLGTGHAVRVAQDWWGDFETLLVLNGDLPLLSVESLNAFMGRFNEDQPDCAILSFVARNPAAYGRVIHSSQNGVRVVEFKDATEEQRQVREVNAGCYAFNVTSLQAVIGKITNDNAQKEYYLPDALKLMAEAGMRVEAYPMPEEDLSGVNTQSELAAATAVMRRRILERWMNCGVRVMDPATAWVGPDVELAPGVVLMPNVQLWGHSRVGEGTVIGSGSILTNAVLGRNVTLVANVVIENSELCDFAKAGPFVYIREGSRLEERAFAGKFVELKKTVVGRGSKVPHLSYMGDATLGEGVNIGAGTITCNYDGRNKHPTKIGDGCFVGSDTMFVAPVVMEDGAATAAGSVITESVPEGALGVGRARQRNIDGWFRRKQQLEHESGR